MRAAVPIHNLRQNHSERSPRHIAILDTESRMYTTAGHERHELRLWSATLTHRHNNKHRKGNHDQERGHTAAELAQLIDRWGRHDRSLWVYMHNTNFDLGVTRLPLLLKRMGWRIGDNALTTESPWCRLSIKDHTITLADSFSMLPRSLDYIAGQLRMEKLELPANDDSDEAWFARCDRDVEILEAAMLQLADWWDNNKLGCWSLTGAATGWNSMKHRPHRDKVVIDPDPEALAFERTAVYGGRREVFRVGHFSGGGFMDVDFSTAHLTICQHLPLPRSRYLKFAGEPTADDWADPDRWGMIADCTVRTETPRYPCRINHRIWHPVGTFRTTLAGPELLEAKQRGELVQIHGGYKYWLSPHMADWASWLQGVLNNETQEHPPMAAVAGKGWSKSVPGKWATRTSQEVQTLPSEHNGWLVERGIDHPSEQPATILHMDGTQTWYINDLDADDCFPAVLAWIQSAVRVRMGRLIDAIKPDRRMSCNTDGAIIRARLLPNFDAILPDLWPLVPRCKAIIKDLEIKGPNHIIVDGNPRLSGVPRAGALKWNDAYAWMTWPSLKRQLEQPESEGYTRDARRVDLSHVPVNKWVLDNGQTIPPRCVVADGGETQLLAFDQLPWPDCARALAARQHPDLQWVGDDQESGLRAS